MIYCVEDDAGIRDIEIYTLRSVGFKAEGFSNGASFFKAMGEQLPDLVLLDVMLPDEDGVTILKKLRANPMTRLLPVIMATAKGAEYDKVISLDLGADDYLVKPFGMMEMVSRVRAVLRRAGHETNASVLQNGTLIMNVDEHTVTVDQRPVSLTLKEFDLLKTLISHPGIVFTREQLMSIVWNTDYYGETRTIDMHIGSMRQKLGACGEMIETVRGVGYRMNVSKK